MTEKWFAINVTYNQISIQGPHPTHQLAVMYAGSVRGTGFVVAAQTLEGATRQYLHGNVELAK